MKYPKIFLKPETFKSKSRHPWIFSKEIAKIKGNIAGGDIAGIFSAEGNFLGNGYYNPKSNITVRILSTENKAIDAEFIAERINTAFQKRKPLLTKTNAMRIVFSEADGLAGLILDLYNNVIVFQVASLGMERLKEYVLSAVKQIIKPRAIYEKSNDKQRLTEGLAPAVCWHTKEKQPLVDIFEGKIIYRIDLEGGHKTGFYLDQRTSRMSLKGLVKNKKVLDLFCYTGGFAIAAGVYGAKKVLGIDIKEEWLKYGHINSGLNEVADTVEFKKAHAFDMLTDIVKGMQRFDVIILDPPSFAKNKHTLKQAISGYSELNRLAMYALNTEGILCTFSCSHHIRAELFAQIIKKAASMAHKKYAIVKRCHQAQDHPIVKNIPESEYLKGYFLKVSPV
jgi:23S rRNA (cytosine1962-C5)-methyltransferase